MGTVLALFGVSLLDGLADQWIANPASTRRKYEEVAMKLVSEYGVEKADQMLQQLNTALSGYTQIGPSIQGAYKEAKRIISNRASKIQKYQKVVDSALKSAESNIIGAESTRGLIGSGMRSQYDENAEDFMATARYAANKLNQAVNNATKEIDASRTYGLTGGK